VIRSLIFSALILTSGTGFTGGSLDRSHLEVRVVEGEQLVTLHAQNLPASEVIEALCDSLGRRLRWLEEIDNIPNITVHLVDGYPNDVVRTVVGAAGLRVRIGSDQVEVSKEFSPFAKPEELLFAAEAAYTMALRRFPTDPRRVEARESLAEMAVAEGRPDRAVEHYGYLIEEFRAARDNNQHVAPELLAFMPEALVRSGRLQVELRRWEAARESFQLLADISGLVPHTYFPEALRELARCQCELGDPKKALYQVRALTSNPEFAPKDDMDRARRLLVEARALILTEEPINALRLLDQCAGLGQISFKNYEVMELRAKALEKSGRPAEAAQAWLGFYNDVKLPEERRKALTHAASLSLMSGDEVAVMMIYEMAKEHGWESDVQPALNLARARLSIDSTNFLAGSAAERLLRAEDLFTSGLYGQARQVLDSLYEVHLALGQSEKLRLALVYAKVLDHVEGIDSAIRVLRTMAATLETQESRTSLYLLAAELYETHQMFDEAIEAYAGTL
jgi:tetratricopeptide (TPR) repeat protein